MPNSQNQDFIWGYGLTTTCVDSNSNGVLLDSWFPEIGIGTFEQAQASSSSEKMSKTMERLVNIAEADKTADARHVVREVRFITSEVEVAPTTAEDIYLRLHALSMRLVKPNTVNLDGLFSLLENVVWTNFGPCSPNNFEETRLKLLEQHGSVNILSLDKIPRMVDFVVPSGVRIADADRVRLGAYLTPGTTVMHEGFVNYNAGTTGTSMVEGRISQGVVVGDGSDIGGGASIMGTLSGGGKHKISIGRRSLLGANSGIGISLGDDCIVEAGLYITAGTKVVLDGKIYKGKELSGKNGLLFRRNSQTGAIEVILREQTPGIELNSALHAN
ncbi:MAG: 2,3,4,5-tetrahydropyridine-2,6-dicarboxylate N-succinyltransferase [Candidatus Ancillula sp.]|nr:2,3,4,5-tetrahydropyridine-2,6-dicarboxylate N-succinyltransferase [Candidatus Ancillula sp.]